MIVIKNLTKKYNNSYAIKDISFTIKDLEFVSLVGESGSGKSTIAKILTNIVKKDKGEIYIDDENIDNITTYKRNQKINMVLQNPYSAFDPLISIEKSLKDVIQSNNLKNINIEEELIKYGLKKEDRFKKGNEFSGGQLQRLSILRSMLLKPELLILDEVTSNLDYELKIQILELIKNINISILFITHDIDIIKDCADKIIVLKEAEIVEVGSKEDIFINPKQEYTKKLINSVIR